MFRASGEEVYPRAFVYLTYWDDSGTDVRSDVMVFGGIVVPANIFPSIESLHSRTVKSLIPDDRLGDFKEFHAFELMNGQGVFEGIPFERRRHAMATLLCLVNGQMVNGKESPSIPYYYCAIDKARLQATAAGSADPLDVGFRMCLFELREWVTRQWKTGREITNAADFLHHVMTHGFPGVSLVIVDDCDKYRRDRLKESFRHFRAKHYSGPPSVDSSLIHDAMYFGDSVESVGLQIADACNWVMRRHLSGQEEYNLFNFLKSSAVCVKPEPDWSMLRAALRCHDDA